MYFKKRDLEKTANKAASQAKDFLHNAGEQAYDTTQRLAKQAKSAYPQLASSLHHAADQALAQGRNAAHNAGGGLAAAACALGCGLRFAGSSAAKIGIGYALIKILSAEKNEASQQGADLAATVKTHIQEKPVESALIALGAGYFIGKILR